MKFKVQDISKETFGKYQYGTSYLGYDWADSDFKLGGGCGGLKMGSVSAPGFPGDNKPRIRYIPIVSEIRYFFGIL